MSPRPSFNTRLLKLAALLAGAALALAGLVYAFSDRIPATPVTSITRYDAIRATLTRPVFSRFPRAVPPTASDARFFYSSGFLRRPTIAELRMVLPEGALGALASESAKLARAVPDQAKAESILPELRWLNDGAPLPEPRPRLDSWIVSHPAWNQWAGVVINYERREAVIWAIDN